MTLVDDLTQVLSQRGPNLTLMHASPAADFICDGQKKHTAEGWWVFFSCDATVTSRIDGDVEVRFKSSGPGVHGGRAWSWTLALMPGEDGQKQLMLHDDASFPSPILNMFSYHAIGECRRALLNRLAVQTGSATRRAVLMGTAIQNPPWYTFTSDISIPKSVIGKHPNIGAKLSSRS